MLKVNKNVFRLNFCILMSVSTLFITNCTPYYRQHNQNNAANTALNFSISAFIKQDFQTAYSFLRADLSEQFGISELKNLVTKIHPEGMYPFEIKRTYYEIVPNSGLVKIYLNGKAKDNTTFYYLIVTVPENQDYRVSEIYRKDTPYEKTALMQSIE